MTQGKDEPCPSWPIEIIWHFAFTQSFRRYLSFQSFDKTSSGFLAAYLGSAVAESLSRLKFKQAYAVGKAFRSSVPMLFEVPHIESESACDLEPKHNTVTETDIPF
jgi:hypothetical protein